MPTEAALPPGHNDTGSGQWTWRKALAYTGIAWAILVALAWNAWSEMLDQWWNTSTYNHILLVPPILLGLVWLRRRDLACLKPVGWWPGLVLLAGGILAWHAGAVAQVNIVSELGAVVMLQGSLAALLGPRIAAGLLFPLCYMVALVPIGDELIPGLQAVTARLAVALTHASGVPATIEGTFIDTPAGLFEVAEACSGVKFLVAMVTLGALVANLCFVSWTRRAAFLFAAAVVPVLANGLRAWGTIYVAQSRGIQFAAGFDHVVYGWIFFALVMTGVLGVAWRYFDRSPDDPLLDPARIEAAPLLTRAARLHLNGSHTLAAVLGLALCGAWMDRIAYLP